MLYRCCWERHHPTNAAINLRACLAYSTPKNVFIPFLYSFIEKREQKILTTRSKEETSQELECSKCVPGFEQLARFNSHSRLGVVLSPLTCNYCPATPSAKKAAVKPLQAAFWPPTHSIFIAHRLSILSHENILQKRIWSWRINWTLPCAQRVNHELGWPTANSAYRTASPAQRLWRKEQQFLYIK